MVDSTKVLCALFDKITILISGDSPSIFPSLDKMGVGPQRTEKGKNEIFVTIPFIIY